MKTLTIVACALLLTVGACETTPSEPRVVTQVVQVPVGIRCNPQLGAEPDYPDTDEAILATPDIFVMAQLLSAGRILRKAWSAKQAAGLAECRGTPEGDRK